MFLYNMEMQEAIKILSLNNNLYEMIYKTIKSIFEKTIFQNFINIKCDH